MFLLQFSASMHQLGFVVDACRAFVVARTSHLPARLHRVDVSAPVYKARASDSEKVYPDFRSTFLHSSGWNPESDVFASFFSLHASTGNSWLMHAVRFSGLMHHFLKKKSCSADGVPPGAPAAEAALHNFFPILARPAPGPPPAWHSRKSRRPRSLLRSTRYPSGWF